MRQPWLLSNKLWLDTTYSESKLALARSFFLAFVISRSSSPFSRSKSSTSSALLRLLERSGTADGSIAEDEEADMVERYLLEDGDFKSKLETDKYVFKEVNTCKSYNQ